MISAAIASFRQSFPGLQKVTYLDVAGRGLISSEVRAVIEDYLDERSVGGDKEKISESVGLARKSFAKLINAQPSEIAFVKNVSDGINAVATALEWKAGDNIVFCEALEHPSNVFTWYNLAERYGIELRRVPAQDGHIGPEAVLAAVDERTKVVTVALVTFAPGFRTDIEKIGKRCREIGVRVIVDAAQAVGIMHVDVQTMPIDALAVSTAKGLLALYGMGFLYVKEEFAEALHPAYLSRFGVEIESGHEASGATDYEMRAGAGRFDVGNYNYIGCVAAHVSLNQLLAIGTTNIQPHVLGLTDRLKRKVSELGLSVMQTDMRSRDSHIVTVGNRLEDRHDATSDASMSALSRLLLERRIKHSIRRGLLRFSVHGYNNADDIDLVVETISSWRKSN